MSGTICHLSVGVAGYNFRIMLALILQPNALVNLVRSMCVLCAELPFQFSSPSVSVPLIEIFPAFSVWWLVCIKGQWELMIRSRTGNLFWKNFKFFVKLWYRYVVTMNFVEELFSVLEQYCVFPFSQILDFEFLWRFTFLKLTGFHKLLFVRML